MVRATASAAAAASRPDYTQPSVAGATAAAAAQKPTAQPPAQLYIVDTTATPDGGKRNHEMIVDGATKSFAFEHGKPLAMPPAIALKFLVHDAFKLTDAEGNAVAFKRRPKQPEELAAGEHLKLKDDETVAGYDELSTTALQHRVMEMVGGERFAANPSRAAMIAFIVEHKLRTRKLNTSKEPDVAQDAFVPEAEADEDEA